MSRFLLASALLALPAMASAEGETYVFDASHSQIVFSYDHLGFSSTFGMFSGFSGEIIFDEEDPAASSVTTRFPLHSIFTGWEQRDAHFLSEDFFAATEDSMVSFTSTGIEITGDNTALITGDLTIGAVTQEVVLDTTLNKSGEHPLAGRPWLGFDATTTLSRTAFDAGLFAPAVGDEVSVMISLEAMIPET